MVERTQMKIVWLLLLLTSLVCSTSVVVGQSVIDAPDFGIAAQYVLAAPYINAHSDVIVTGKVAASYQFGAGQLQSDSPVLDYTGEIEEAIFTALMYIYNLVPSRTLALHDGSHVTLPPGVYLVEIYEVYAHITFDGHGVYIIMSYDDILITQLATFTFINGAVSADVYWFSDTNIKNQNTYVPGTILSGSVEMGQTSDRVYAYGEINVRPESGTHYVTGFASMPLPDPPVPSSSSTGVAGPDAPDGPFDCPTYYRTDLTACAADDDRCHVDQIGPVATCVNGPPVSKDMLFYEMPVKIVSVTTGMAPHVFEVVVRVPIFQAYDTLGYFHFVVGTVSTKFDMSSLSPSNTCNTMASQLTSGAWPQTYSELRDRPACGWANADTALANEALRLERENLKVWVNRNGVFPWQAATDGGAIYDTGKAACWRDILGDINAAKTASDSVAMTAGLISHVAIPDDSNFIQYTLHVNADTVWGACNPMYPGMTYTATDIGTDHESIKYRIPITAVQRTSNRKQITAVITTTLQMVTAGNVTVSTSIYQPVTINELGLEAESLETVHVGPLDPDTSMASAHRLDMTFLLTVEKPEDDAILSLGPLDPETDIVLNIPGKSVNCYGDSFKHAPTTFEPILPCLVDGDGKTQCQFRIHLLSEARTDVYDGSSFATCAGTIDAEPNMLDKLHIFGIRLQLCTWDGCSYVSSDPIRVVSSFFVPIFPLRSVAQNEQIYALLLATAETPIAPLTGALAEYGARRFVTQTDTINVAIVTRPALWGRYSLSIRSSGNAIQLFRADLGVLINNTTGWTLVADQTTLVANMRYSPKWRVATGSPESPILGYPACAGVGIGCDGFSFNTSSIMVHTTGPQVKFVVRVTIAMQEYNPVSRRLFSTINVPKTIGAWSTTVTQRPADVHVQASASNDGMLPMESSRRRKAVPDAQTSPNNAPFTGTIGSTFVFARSFIGVNDTAAIDDETDEKKDVVLAVTGALTGFGISVVIGLMVFMYCRRRHATAAVSSAIEEQDDHTHVIPVAPTHPARVPPSKQFSFNYDQNNIFGFQA